jgi:hypothetical protein
MLLYLHDAGFRVWPYENAAFGVHPRQLLVEIYTRLMTGPVAKSNAAARKVYLTAKRRADLLYKTIPRGVLQKALGSEDAFDAFVTTLEMVRHASEFPKLRRTTDPALRLEGITWRPGVTRAG